MFWLLSAKFLLSIWPTWYDISWKKIYLHNLYLIKVIFCPFVLFCPYEKFQVVTPPHICIKYWTPGCHRSHQCWQDLFSLLCSSPSPVSQWTAPEQMHIQVILTHQQRWQGLQHQAGHQVHHCRQRNRGERKLQPHDGLQQCSNLLPLEHSMTYKWCPVHLIPALLG